MTNEPKDAKPSRKELARQARHAAYLRAKAWRANDPKHLAMKEAAKQRRREAYQAAKGRKKADAAEQRRKQTETEERAAKQAVADEDLMRMVRPATKAPEP